MRQGNRQTFQLSLIEFIFFITFCLLLLVAFFIQENQKLDQQASDDHKQWDALNNQVNKLREKINVGDTQLSNIDYLKYLANAIDKPIIDDDWQHLITLHQQGLSAKSVALINRIKGLMQKNQQLKTKIITTNKTLKVCRKNMK